ncbi:MAG: hypothetical protein V3V14_10475 [Saprospiraceae bacterium]
MSRFLLKFADLNEIEIASILKEKKQETDLIIPLPEVKNIVIPTVFSEEYKKNVLPVVSDKKEISVTEIDKTLVISRTFGFDKFASIIKSELSKGDLILLGKGSKVLGRVSKSFTAIRQVLDQVWQQNGNRLFVVSNNGTLTDVTSRDGFNRIIEEARQNSESRATVQYIKKTNTSRLTSPINYYLRELNSLNMALDKTYKLIYQYRETFKPLTIEETLKVAENVFEAIQSGLHGIYPYPLEVIKIMLLEFKDKVDEIETEYTIRLCMKCKIKEIGKSAQLCNKCYQEAKIIFANIE